MNVHTFFSPSRVVHLVESVLLHDKALFTFILLTKLEGLDHDVHKSD